MLRLEYRKKTRLAHDVECVCSPSTVTIANGSGRRNTSRCKVAMWRVSLLFQSAAKFVRGGTRSQDHDSSHLGESICSNDGDPDFAGPEQIRTDRGMKRCVVSLDPAEEGRK